MAVDSSVPTEWEKGNFRWGGAAPVMVFFWRFGRYLILFSSDDDDDSVRQSNLYTSKLKEIDKEDVKLYLLLNQLTQSHLQHNAYGVKDKSACKLDISEKDRKYALELISEVGLLGAKPVETPIDVNVKLTSKQYDDQTNQNHEDQLVDQGAYQKLVGKLLYLNMTRSNIAYSVQILSQFLQLPKRSHMEAALRIIKYIKKYLGQGILLSSCSKNEVTVYCDVDWAVCPLTRRSITGYIIKIRDFIVSWKTKKQTTVSRSSAEAEYRSLAFTVTKLVWLLGMLKDLDAKIKLPVSVFSDSKAVIQLAANPSIMKG
ncbi:uncharacterized mitochondrial protein AtMg00810-like [Capsicum annuum]|uniref:uncharacterized mitochondrial protein AtMg00810-like n=1 Tax=Capsicum annuum TaxID=4072 RepID=UPI001FB17F8E|nr:uncharacterized mitochondrial protein AtMg00810-like [Capsicum annuum]